MNLRWLLRILFVAFATVFAMLAYENFRGKEEWDFEIAAIFAAIAALVATGIVLFEIRFQRNLAREIVAVVFGLAAGIIVTAFLIAILIVFILPGSGGNLGSAFERIQMWMPPLVTAVCYISVTIVLQTKGDFRFLVPYIDFSGRGSQDGGYLLDTSSIIDGRVVEICATNILAQQIYIPDFVIRELQAVADSTDRLKRKRGRRGLDMVGALQRSDHVRIHVLETEVPERCDVDLELVRLARQRNARIVTNDFNLNKVAQIEGLRVVNLNDLSNALKPMVLPGEPLTVKIIRPGEEPGQGIGYLDDGTMVVAEQTRTRIGEAVRLVVTGAIQTSAGRMVFGKPEEAARENDGSA